MDALQGSSAIQVTEVRKNRSLTRRMRSRTLAIVRMPVNSLDVFAFVLVKVFAVTASAVHEAMNRYFSVRGARDATCRSSVGLGHS